MGDEGLMNMNMNMNMKVMKMRGGWQWVGRKGERLTDCAWGRGKVFYFLFFLIIFVILFYFFFFLAILPTKRGHTINNNILG